MLKLHLLTSLPRSTFLPTYLFFIFVFGSFLCGYSFLYMYKYHYKILYFFLFVFISPFYISLIYFITSFLPNESILFTIRLWRFLSFLFLGCPVDRFLSCQSCFRRFILPNVASVMFVCSHPSLSCANHPFHHCFVAVNVVCLLACLLSPIISPKSSLQPFAVCLFHFAFASFIPSSIRFIALW